VGDKAFFVVETLGGEHVTGVLGDEVGSALLVFRKHLCGRGDAQRAFAVVGEVIERIDIFEELAVGNIPHARGLTERIEGMRQFVRASVEVVVVVRFVDAHAPEDDAGMIAVSTYHVAKIGHRVGLPCIVADVLPAGKFFEDEKSQLIACIEKMGGLGIMACADNNASELALEYLCVAPLGIGAHGIPRIRIFLMAI